jgi:hypothetical protein
MSDVKRYKTAAIGELPACTHWGGPDLVLASDYDAAINKQPAEPRGKEPPHCPSCNCGEPILGLPETKPAQRPEDCVKCGKPFPDGCGGVFKYLGACCALNGRAGE